MAQAGRGGILLMFKNDPEDRAWCSSHIRMNSLLARVDFMPSSPLLAHGRERPACSSHHLNDNNICSSSCGFYFLLSSPFFLSCCRFRIPSWRLRPREKRGARSGFRALRSPFPPGLHLGLRVLRDLDEAVEVLRGGEPELPHPGFS